MSWFHQLSGGKSGRPPKSSVSFTLLLSVGAGPVAGACAAGAGVSVDADPGEGASGAAVR